MRLFTNFCFFTLITASLFASPYKIETITFPKDMPVEVGAIEFDGKGDLYLALRRGDIMIATPSVDPTGFKWRHFASGFHNPCGIHIKKPGDIIVSQMAELTGVVDTDQDGVADVYQALATDFGLSGNYHETMDICPDGSGGLYLAPGTASHNGPTFKTPRGPYSDAGRLGRNYSSVKWRGYVLHWQHDKPLVPFSSGYRMHNGIERSPKGDIWCGDNQGDWRASSPVYHVQPDSFAGHPSSLVWDSRFAGIENPLYLPRVLLDDLWNKPAFRLPRSMMNSIGEPAFVPEGGVFGPFDGQMLLPDQSGDRIVRCMPEWVDGNYQGASTMFLSGAPLVRGNNRLAFSPDGKSLYTGQTGRGWGKLSEGLQRITYTGGGVFEVQNCQLQADGFQITFTQPLTSSEQVSVERYRYEYGYHYGGKQLDTEKIELLSVRQDGNKLNIRIGKRDLLPNYVYRFNLGKVISKNGELFSNQLIYTLNRLVRPVVESKATIEKDDDGHYTIRLGDRLFTRYLTTGFSNPILYPIHTAKGTPLTRDWPVNPAPREGEQHDHPHHRSLFIGHESINGVDFWHDTRESDGRIEHARTIETRSGEDRALLRTFNQWKDSKGKVICTDTREMQWGVHNEVRYMDLELNIHASHGDLTFGEKKDGVIGIRTHPDLRLKPAPGKGVAKVYGKAANSIGTTGKDIWGQKADWVHYWGKVEGKDSGIAILGHPLNQRGQTWWHARDYGLVSANPFGPVKNGGDGKLVVPEGGSFTMRYRFLFHDRAENDIDIRSHYQAYCQQPLYPATYCIPIPKTEDKVGPSKSVLAMNVPPKGGVFAGVSRMVNGRKVPNSKVKTHGLIEGAKIYADRDYQFSEVPEHLRAGDYIQTFNDDKMKIHQAAYRLTLDQPAFVYLLVDERIEGALDWLNKDSKGLKFEKTKDKVETNSNFRFNVYMAEADPGVYDLGDQTDASFYTVVGVNRD